jgi:hypothetical protein
MFTISQSKKITVCSELLAVIGDGAEIYESRAKQKNNNNFSSATLISGSKGKGDTGERQRGQPRKGLRFGICMFTIRCVLYKIG